jgi:glycosyltransferase involved in cell wall biosynthesis
MEGLDTPQHDLYKLYNSADLCVVANQCEGFSFVELEAMACGIPVLCTNSGGNMDYILPNENALVVKRDIQSIRDGMTTLLYDKNKMRKFKYTGLKTAGHPKFSWDNITVNLNNVFLNLLK